MNYLLDTCVISELAAKNPNLQVLAWIDNVPDEHIFLSVLTIGEIQRGISKLPDSNRKDSLTDWLETNLLNRFSGRFLTLDVEVTLRWGDMVASLEKMGRPLPAIDSLFAAQALTYKMTFVTRNVKDFIDTGVNLLNPWQAK
ncbi:type II toxin-antitoxin system VapC family toxin [Candidatus Leptofilum sp.]|uniref:type II toxin-antitoxin system VapC family toxin n=1 Tax=Candidatus Leptofilum sp. TaxID=3241576 RepID=UPI003B59FE67